LFYPATSFPRFALIRQLLIAVLALTAGAHAQKTSSGDFGASMRPSNVSTASVSSLESARPQVASVTLSSARLTAGESTSLTIRLTEPAPEPGTTVSLTTSDDNIVSVPAFVKIPAGQDSATIQAYTASDSSDSKVSITAFTDSTLAGASLQVAASTTPPFTLALSPNTLSILPGNSGSSTAKTKANAGYSHSLKLTATNLPSGVSLSFTPVTVPAPGTGSSAAALKVSSSVAVGTYSIHVTASDGTNSRSVILKLKVGSSSSGPGATFTGCWYQSGGNSYQGVMITTTNSGTWPFYANLYFGATCNPNDWADDFGLGQLLQFNPMYTWTMWFNHFPNQTAMSAQYQIGPQLSQCINYETVPTCP
jgi:hypothetical protein